jgi:hypothetical protein
MSRTGQCVPHSGAPALRTTLRSIHSAVTPCTGSPLCDAQPMASPAPLNCNQAAAPDSTGGSACTSLFAERGNTGRSMSLSEATTLHGHRRPPPRQIGAPQVPRRATVRT